MNLREEYDHKSNTELPKAVDYRKEHTTLFKNDVIRYWEGYSKFLESKVENNVFLADVSNNDIDLDNINVKIPPNKTTKYKLIPKKKVSVCGVNVIGAWCDGCEEKQKSKCKLYKEQPDC